MTTTTDRTPRTSSRESCLEPLRSSYDLGGATAPEGPLGYHVIMRLADDRVIAPTVPLQRRAARVLLARGADRGLLAFRVVDTHIHAVLLCSRTEAGRFAQAAGSALRQALGLGVGFDRARLRPITGQGHLANSVRYVVRQERHHDVRLDPLHEGSSLPDMLGLRVIDATLPARLRQRLPRLGPLDWIAEAGWTGFEGAAPSLEWLSDAAAAIVARPHLGADDPGSVTARYAAVHVAKQAGLGVRGIATLLGLAPRTVRKALRRAPAAETLRALTLQLRIRNWLGSAATTTTRGQPARGG